MRHALGWKSGVSRVLKFQNLHLTLKYELQFSKIKIQRSRSEVKFQRSNFILCLLTSLKCDLRKVEKAVFQGFWNLNFDLRLWNMSYNCQRSKLKVQSYKWKVKGQISKHLKHRFLNRTQDAFWASQEAENEFKVNYHSLKHSFFRLTQGARPPWYSVEIS